MRLPSSGARSRIERAHANQDRSFAAVNKFAKAEQEKNDNTRDSVDLSDLSVATPTAAIGVKVEKLQCSTVLCFSTMVGMAPTIVIALGLA